MVNTGLETLQNKASLPLTSKANVNLAVTWILKEKDKTDVMSGRRARRRRACS
jgi:hypothetical protein